MAEKKIIDKTQYSVIAVIFREKKILMFERKGEEWETGWEFIKGAMHLGETEEEAALREINEESNVKVKIIGKVPRIYWGKNPTVKIFLKIKATAYACKYISGKVKSNEPEHVSHKWMDYEEAKSKIWLKHGDDVIEQAIKIYESFNSE